MVQLHEPRKGQVSNRVVLKARAGAWSVVQLCEPRKGKVSDRVVKRKRAGAWSLDQLHEPRTLTEKKGVGRVIVSCFYLQS